MFKRSCQNGGGGGGGGGEKGVLLRNLAVQHSGAGQPSVRSKMEMVAKEKRKEQC